MLKEVLLALVMNLATYIWFSTISAKNSKAVEVELKSELGRLQQILIRTQMEATKDLLSEMKQQGDFIRRDEIE